MMLIWPGVRSSGRIAGLAGLACVVAILGCATRVDPVSRGDENQRTEAQSGQGICAQQGWYGDGHCDRFCLAPDVDCGDVSQRPAQVVAEIEAFNASLSADARHSKYCKMASSPFVFYRGVNHLYWKDLASDRRLGLFGGDRTKIWLQGDLHAYNYGSFDNDKGKVVYDLNDFDEVIIADYQMDVWRMAVSLVLIAEQNGGFPTSSLAEILDSLSESYLDTTASYRGNDDERDASFTAANTYGPLDNFLRDIEDSESRRDMLDKWTNAGTGGRIFDRSLAKLTAADPAVEAEIRAAMPRYQTTVARRLQNDPDYFAVKDVARRLAAGTGSLGVPRYYVLIDGQTDGQDDDRILDVKKQGLPSAYPYLTASEHSQIDRAATAQARRTIAGYRALASDADDHLGWMRLSDGDYSARERSPYTEAFPTETLTSKSQFIDMAEQWGMILASAHARSDKDHDASIIDYSFDKQVDILTDGHHGAFRALLREVASVYAAQVNEDYRSFTAHLADSCNRAAPEK